jgi:hypothetical protein
MSGVKHSVPGRVGQVAAVLDRGRPVVRRPGLVQKVPQE